MLTVVAGERRSCCCEDGVGMLLVATEKGDAYGPFAERPVEDLDEYDE